MWRRQVLAACIVVAACSPGDPQALDAPRSSGGSDAGIDPNDGAVSGARLKLTWYQFTDGTRQWSGMYDAQNKELCSPYYPPWSDGNTYCTPDSGGEIVYTNAGCTTKALHYYVDSVCPQAPANYYLEYATVGCESRPAHMYLRGSPITTASYFYKNGNGTCGPANAAQTYDAFYGFGNQVPNTAFVQLTLGAPTGTGRLGVRYYESADGLRFPWILHDTMLDADCNASYYSDASTAARCVPNDSGYAYYAHDAGCTQPELSLASTCTTPKFAYTFPATSCPGDSETYYTVGAQTTAPPLFEPIGASCAAQGTSSNTTYYALGGQVATAPLTYAADTGTAHRIQLIHYTTPEGTRFRDPYTLYDSQMGTDCYPETLPDGTIRCVAYGGYIYSYFTSSACTTPIDIVEIYSGPSTCAAPVVPKYARKDVAPNPGTCTYGTEVHTITTPHPSAVYTGAPGSCSVYTPFEASLYNVGPVVELTDFVGAALAQDN
jgi:hypothetical protein